MRKGAPVTAGPRKRHQDETGFGLCFCDGARGVRQVWLKPESHETSFLERNSGSPNPGFGLVFPVDRSFTGPTDTNMERPPLHEMLYSDTQGV